MVGVSACFPLIPATGLLARTFHIDSNINEHPLHTIARTVRTWCGGSRQILAAPSGFGAIAPRLRSLTVIRRQRRGKNGEGWSIRHAPPQRDLVRPEGSHSS